MARYYPIDWQATINWLRGVEFDPDLVWGEVYEEILQTRNFAPLMDRGQTMEAVSRAEEVRQRTDLEFIVEELVEFQSPYAEIEEWRLYRKDLRLALEDAGIKIGKFVLQRAIEIIASSQGFRHNAKDCMSMDSMGNRFLRRVRLRQTITTAPTMPKK